MSTLPRTVPFGTRQLNVNSHTKPATPRRDTIHGLCTNTASGHKLSRDRFMSCARDPIWTPIRPVTFGGTGGLNKLLPMSQIVQAQPYGVSSRRQRIRRVLLVGTKPSLPYRASRPHSSFCRTPPFCIFDPVLIVAVNDVSKTVCPPASPTPHIMVSFQLHRVQPSVSSSRSCQPSAPILTSIFRNLMCAAYSARITMFKQMPLCFYSS